ncbi:MAG: sulfatase [Bacteroidota bacterium]
MKRAAILFSLYIISFSCQNKETHISPPNIVFFLVDDLGWQDTSVPFHTDSTYFNKTYHTPNMERLAREGMKFTNAYASSVCSPTRISLMTGMNAAHHRVTNWTLNLNKKSDGRDSMIQVPEWNMNGLNTSPGTDKTIVANTLPELLKRENYFTIHIGKAHFAATETPCAEPLNCGFDVNIAGHAAGAPGSYNGKTYFGNNPDGSRKNSWSVPGLKKYHGQDINLTEALTLEAQNILDSVIQKKQPFYLYLSHYTVHTPIQEDRRFFQKYLNDGLDTIEARYASMIEGMDKSLGDVLNYLDKNKLSDNTIIIFMSDNGGLSAVGRGGQKHLHNTPLKSGKGSAYEGGIREPMMVKWPGTTKPNSVCNNYLIIEDFFPSILEMAGVQKWETVQTIDGQSFIPFLKNNEPVQQDRPLYWHYPNIWGPTGPGIGPYSAVRKGKWKLIYFHRDQHFELYDLEKDIGEKQNLVEIQIDKKHELASTLSAYLKTVDAQMPTNKLTGKTVPFPDFFIQ